MQWGWKDREGLLSLGLLFGCEIDFDLADVCVIDSVRINNRCVRIRCISVIIVLWNDVFCIFVVLILKCDIEYGFLISFSL